MRWPLALAFTLAMSAAHAAMLDGTSWCYAVAQAGPDVARSAVLRSVLALDATARAHGEPGILNGMAGADEQRLVAAVVRYCGEHPGGTLSTAVQTYYAQYRRLMLTFGMAGE
jgi:hypothetical protein